MREVASRLEQADWSIDVLATDVPGVTVDFDGYAVLHYAAHTATQQEQARVGRRTRRGKPGACPTCRSAP